MDLKELLEQAMQRKQKAVEQAKDLAGQMDQAQQELHRLNTVIVFENGKIVQLQELIGENSESTENGKEEDKLELADLQIK